MTASAVGKKAARPVFHESLKIIFVEFPPSGGLFQFAMQLGEGLARRSHRVELWTGPKPEFSSEESGLRTRSVLPTWHPPSGEEASPTWRRLRRLARGVRHVAAWFVVISLLRTTKPDVIFWSAWRFPVDGWGVQIVRRLLRGATLVVVAHEPRPLAEQSAAKGLYKNSKLHFSALRGAFASVDLAFVLGENAKSILRQSWTMSAPVHVIPHGDEGIFRKHGGILIPASQTAPHVLFFGSITSYKGLDDLLMCWPSIKQRVPAASICIAGALSSDVDGDMLRTRVEQLDGAELRVGYVPPDQVPALFEQARLVALPYRRSTQSGVAHLAFTFARPVVASRVGDIPAVVTHQENGLLIEPGNKEQLVSAISELLLDPAEATRLGDSGQAALMLASSWDTVAAKVESGIFSVRP